MFFGWRVVAGAFVGMMLTTGFFSYSFTVLVNPIREEFGASLEQVMYAPTISTLCGLLFAPLAGWMVDRYPVRYVMTSGCFAMVAGFWLMSQAPSLTLFVAAFGISVSAGNAFAGAAAGSAAVSRWFTASRGRALGFASMGTSLGGIVLPALISYWLESSGWRGALQNLAWLTLLVITPFIWFNIHGKPSDIGLEPEASPENEAGGDIPGTSMGQIMRTRSFWLIGLSMGSVFAAFSSMVANIAPYTTRLGHSDGQVSSLIALLALFGLIGKLLFGMAADKISLKVGLWMAHGLLATAFLVLMFEPPFFAIMFAAVCIGLSTGGMLPVWNALMAKVFGIASFGRAMGAMGPVITLSLMPGFTIVGALYDRTGSYTTGLVVFTGAIALAAALLLPLKLEPAGIDPEPPNRT